MQKESSFISFIDKYFDSQIADLDRERKQANTFSFIYISVCLFVTVGWLVLVYFNTKESVFFNTRFVIISVILWSVAYYFITRLMNSRRGQADANFENSFKEQIIRPIVSFIDPSFVYRPDPKISRSMFCRNLLIDSSTDFEFYSEDLIEGTYDTVEFQLYDYYMTEEKRNGEVRHIARGQHFRASFNKPIRCKLRLLPKKGSQLDDYLNSYMGEPVILEDDNFHKEFEVYTDDQVEARYILTPAFMEKLLTLKKVIDAPISISFHRNFIYIVTETNRSNFDISRLSKIKKENFIAYYREVNLYCELIDLLNINVKIWQN